MTFVVEHGIFGFKPFLFSDACIAYIGTIWLHPGSMEQRLKPLNVSPHVVSLFLAAPNS